MPPTIRAGRPCGVSRVTAAVTISGPIVRPISPPTIQKLIPRPRLRPESLPPITGPIECSPAELKPATSSSRASKP